jgi:deglycase
MTQELRGQRVGILAADGVERIELEQPRGALHGAGATTEIISLHPGEIQARQFDMESAGSFPVDRVVAECPPMITTRC